MSHTTSTHRPFSVFSAGLPVLSWLLPSWRHRIQILKNLPFQDTEPYQSLVLLSILFVWKNVSVSKHGVEILHILPWCIWCKQNGIKRKTVNVGDQNGKRHSAVWSIWKIRELHTIFLKNGIITIIKLIVNLIMCGLSGKQKGILNLSFYIGPNIGPRFCLQYCSVRDHLMACCQNERRRHDSQISE